MSHFASDTFFSNVVSLRGNKCVQLFSNKCNFVVSYPIKSKSEASDALTRFVNEVGIPTEILNDRARELKLGEWGKICKKFRIKSPTTEPYSPRQNPAELRGGIVKRKVISNFKKTAAPIRLWDCFW